MGGWSSRFIEKSPMRKLPEGVVSLSHIAGLRGAFPKGWKAGKSSYLRNDH